MKYYAEVQSERATKKQGGNKFINTIITRGKEQVARVLIKYDNVIVFDGNDKIVWNKLLKGKKQKSECECTGATKEWCPHT